MEKSQELANFEQVIEKIVFREDELETLKIAIKNFTTGKTTAQELKQLLLQCRGRMVEEITAFAFFVVDSRNEEQPPSSVSNEVESELRKEIQEKNELLETVAKRINQLVAKLNNEEPIQVQEPISIEEVKEEINRCLDQIGAKAWINMCYYEDYQFFVKLYPKLEKLYEERFGTSDKNSKPGNEGKEPMTKRMKKLGFPKEIETVVIKYIKIRNNFQHSMDDLSTSNLELARKVFVNVFLYLMISNLKSEFLLNDREVLYNGLADFFSRRLTGNSIFRKDFVGRLKTVF